MTDSQAVPLSIIDHASKMKDEGDWPSLELAARQILRLDPANPVGHDYLGIALCLQGHVTAGVAEHERAVSIAPREPLYWHDYAVTLARLWLKMVDASSAEAMRRSAEEKFEHSLELDPRYWPAYAALMTMMVSQAADDNLGEGERFRAEYRANELAVRFATVFPKGHALRIDVRISARPESDAPTTTLTLVYNGEQMVLSHDALRIDAAGDTLSEALREFLAIHAILVEEFCETKEPLSESGKRYADALHLPTA